MNKEELLNMQAGYEMDLLVAEKLMGWKWFHYEEASYFRRNDVFDYVIIVDKLRGQTCVFNNSLPKFSTEISAAWEVIEKLGLTDFSIEKVGDHYCVNLVIESACAETAPLAICRAALMAATH
jgi:hypothetical protein